MTCGDINKKLKKKINSPFKKDSSIYFALIKEISGGNDKKTGKWVHSFLFLVFSINNLPNKWVMLLCLFQFPLSFLGTTHFILKWLTKRTLWHLSDKFHNYLLSNFTNTVTCTFVKVFACFQVFIFWHQWSLPRQSLSDRFSLFCIFPGFSSILSLFHLFSFLGWFETSN